MYIWIITDGFVIGILLQRLDLTKLELPVSRRLWSAPDMGAPCL